MPSDAVSLTENVGPTPESVAVFVRDRNGFEGSPAETVIGGNEYPGRSESLRRQESGESEQLQPAPLISVTLTPGGAESATNTSPVADVLPAFCTVMVHATAPFGVKLPECATRITRFVGLI